MAICVYGWLNVGHLLNGHLSVCLAEYWSSAQGPFVCKVGRILVICIRAICVYGWLNMGHLHTRHLCV